MSQNTLRELMLKATHMKYQNEKGWYSQCTTVFEVASSIPIPVISLILAQSENQSCLRQPACLAWLWLLLDRIPSSDNT